MNPYLSWLSRKTQTSWWHDSADLAELEDAMNSGAVGVTTNPVLVRQAIYDKPEFWKDYLQDIPGDLSTAARSEEIIRRVTVEVAKKLQPIYEKTNGEQGYVCAQVHPSKAADRETMKAMVHRLHSWAPNIAVKIPATAAGLDVLEECAAEGITLTVTVSFTLPQVLEIGKRYEAGRKKAQDNGIEPGKCFSVVMVGRIDDYIRDVARDRKNTEAKETDIIQCGTIIMKRALELYKERGYNAILMPAGMRGGYHSMELAGAPITMSIHPKIQKPLSEEKGPFSERFEEAIDPEAVKRLNTIPEFVRAAEPEGMQATDFITYGVVQKTLAQFSENWALIDRYTISS
ncbi:MAG: transaldolase family protein [Spirochaetota bacterium]